MAGLLAWAADVVGGVHGNSNELSEDTIPPVFTEEQQKYVQELDSKASSLTRTIQDLRLRLPPPDISQRLPHLLAHSLASNAALALQLNAHSATKEQVRSCLCGNFGLGIIWVVVLWLFLMDCVVCCFSLWVLLSGSFVILDFWIFCSCV